jgi:acyl-CoA reductase-like NAD-dependent aldehyde dehydrogenase
MKNITLLINNEEIDTGVYEYYPYANSVIRDFRTTRKVIRDIKQGKNITDASDYIYARYSIGDENICRRALESAYEAAKIFKHFPLKKRRKIMGDIHDLLVENKDEIIKLFIVEGHPLQLALWEFEGMERGVAKETLDLYNEQMLRGFPPAGKEKIFLLRHPDGVVCVNPPKNAPTSNSFVATGALLAGNTIIIKPPFRNPVSSIYVWKNIVNEAVKRNGGPPGTINIILGNSGKILDQWLESPYVNDIFHFGASDVGIEIGKRVYCAGKKPILELSGNDLLFVWKDADIKKAAEALIDAFLGSTQICMVPKNAIVHEDSFDSLCREMLKKTRLLKVGLPDNPETCLSPVIKISQYFEFLEDAKLRGAQVLCGGRRLNFSGEEDKDGMYIEPTLLKIDNESKGLEMLCVTEENFFPLLPLLKITSSPTMPKHKNLSKDDIIFSKMANISEQNKYGLRISAWVKSPHYIDRITKEMNHSGLLRINSRHVGFSLYIATHGGVKKSSGPYGGMTYICEKTSYLQGVSISG